jgi:CDGSH-type Zn-finger protein
MDSNEPARPLIEITENGPYLVSGHVPLSEEAIGPDDAGNSWMWLEGRTYEVPAQYALCRCGHSSSKPFCDGTHAKIAFDGTETASRESFEQQAEVFDGPTMELHDAQPLCAFARFCDGYGSVWDTISATDAGGSRELVAYQGSHCPSGRLVVRDKQNDGSPAEPEVEPSIVLVEDPGKAVSGPLYVRGGIAVVSPDGRAYEERNRVTLCRCGASSNKPFCDGTHAHIGFRAHDSAREAVE